MGRKRRNDDGSEQGSGSGGEDGYSSSASSGGGGSGSDADSTSSGASEDIVNIDFEYFSPAEIDFHAMKRMLVGSFGDDAEEFDLGELVDLVLAQSAIGSTVKMEDDADPYAFMTAVGLRAHAGKKVVQQITGYLRRKDKGGRLGAVLDGHSALLLNERVVNMPPQIVPPMLRMLGAELQQAAAAGEPFDFEHLVLVCPMFREVPQAESDSDSDSAQRRRPQRPAQPPIDAYAHPEDEIIEEFAQLKFDFGLSRSSRVPAARNAFADAGLAPSRRCLVLRRADIPALAARLEEALAP
ncbi:Mss4p nuclear export [Coemansia helicoidea]|uniref:Mss4p nuclear export n=1 Tax=Coemansia helicoidea TaxID=1286919 RepID=A0ACC1KUK8_9FUNG|nr:Mss4p nuclear export [Coemansia helicoidea]